MCILIHTCSQTPCGSKMWRRWLIAEKKFSGQFETVAGRYDTSKLLKIGYSYRVTSSPKIASKT